MSGRCICVCGVSLFESRVPLLQSVWLMLDQWCVAVHLVASKLVASNPGKRVKLSGKSTYVTVHISHDAPTF